ncbi:MAG: RNA polymerase sigma factor [Geminicoccaceae bacterium]|nr:RNA polymerase sigma factor [Geminicoccaceae bacterium]
MSPDDFGEVAALIPNLRRYARVLVRDPDQADDLVQDCLERAITRYHSFTPGTNLRSWLFTILLNLVRSQARTNKRRGTMVNIDEIRDVPGHTSPPEQPLTMRDLQAAFDTLPASFQEVIVLVGIEGMSYEEAADVVGIPVGTVRSRLSRARDQLRRALDEPAAARAKAPRPKAAATIDFTALARWAGAGWPTGGRVAAAT